MNHQTSSSTSALMKLWERIPIVVRAIISGFLVFAIMGSLAWTAILIFIPAPWSLLVTAVLLGGYLKYFSGSWWPKATSAPRRQYFRSTKLSAKTWQWSLITAFLAVIILQAALIIAFRLIGFNAEVWALGVDFSNTPSWQIWSFILMAALVAGITEEVGFRGYMQVPLENKYSATVAITIVSIVFVVAHLNQAWAGGILLILFLISALWGVLARVSGSLIPGIISHTVTDIINFSYWWTDVAGRFTKRPISTTGLDTHFIVWLAILVISLALFGLTARKTKAASQQA